MTSQQSKLDKCKTDAMQNLKSFCGRFYECFTDLQQAISSLYNEIVGKAVITFVTCVVKITRAHLGSQVS